MAGFTFRKAARTARKIRVAVDGPSGSGKTYSLLRLAFAMKSAGLCNQVAVIDTENGGSEAYAGESPDGTPWDFQVLNLDTYSPVTYVQAMSAAAEAGFDCVVIDSLSHAWMGKDGALDMVDKKGGRFDAWKDVTPFHRQLIDAIIHCPAHVLASMRSKAEYVVEENERGKKVPRKVGTAPVQRDGMEYEFDVYGSIDIDHAIRVSKSRCSALQDAHAPKPDARFWAPLVKWLSSADPVKPLHETLAANLKGAATLPALKSAWMAADGECTAGRITADQLAALATVKDARKAALSQPPAHAPASPATIPIPPVVTGKDVYSLCEVLGGLTGEGSQQVVADVCLGYKVGDLDRMTGDQLRSAAVELNERIKEAKDRVESLIPH